MKQILIAGLKRTLLVGHALLRVLLHEDIIDLFVLLQSLCGIYYGLSLVHRPTAIVVVSAIILVLVVVSKILRRYGPSR